MLLELRSYGSDKLLSSARNKFLRFSRYHVSQCLVKLLLNRTNLNDPSEVAQKDWDGFYGPSLVQILVNTLACNIESRVNHIVQT